MGSPTTRDVHVDSVLTNISIAYRNPNYIADQVFPVVRVNKQSDLFFVYEKTAWLRNEAAYRAPGTMSQTADYGVTTASYFAMPWYINHILPDEVRDNADNPLTRRSGLIQ
jgi:hypothetical protein